MNPHDANPPPAPSFLKKWGPRGAGALAVLMVGIQFVPVKAMQNPESKPALAEPPEVVAILKRACYDCHSHEVRWPWYSQIAPASWLVARDVVEGRESINFSDWPEDEEDRAFSREQAWDSVESGEMPLWFYLPLHPEANLTESDKEILKKWSETEVATDEEEEEAADKPAEGEKAEGEEATDKPTDEKATDQPTDEKAADKPTGEKAADKPTDEKAADKPTGEKAADETAAVKKKPVAKKKPAAKKPAGAKDKK